VTDRLYLADPYLVGFEARVVRETRLGDRTAVVLDRTAFYPEGGGQPADSGTLAGIAVVDVQERDGEVLHVLAGPPPSGRVEGLVDWARRLDHMQQHHGQHLLSAAFERLHRARTVSFHLGEETCTIDLDVPASRLDEPALRAAEAAANEAVWRDLPVTARDFSPEELERLPLRKEPTKGSRVVVVGELPEGPGGFHPPGMIDASPCGGTHPRRTGEVGAVAVLGARKQGEGARVEFICGARVVRALAEAGGRLAAAARALRCAPAEAPQAAARLAEEAAARRKETERLVGALAEEVALRLAAGATGPVVTRLEPPLSGAAGLKAVAAALAARGRVALLGGVDDARAFLCFARPEGPGPHLGGLVRAAAAVLGGKGGGAPDLAQGSGPDPARLDEALDLAREKLAAP
jgi:alanyl-tRNA synthetase